MYFHKYIFLIVTFILYAQNVSTFNAQIKQTCPNIKPEGINLCKNKLTNVILKFAPVCKNLAALNCQKVHKKVTKFRLGGYAECKNELSEIMCDPLTESNFDEIGGIKHEASSYCMETFNGVITKSPPAALKDKKYACTMFDSMRTYCHFLARSICKIVPNELIQGHCSPTLSKAVCAWISDKRIK